jgi:hypothetical protein
MQPPNIEHLHFPFLPFTTSTVDVQNEKTEWVQKSIATNSRAFGHLAKNMSTI